MGYIPKRKNKYSNLVFPTNPIVNTSSFFEDDTISQVTYGNPSYGTTLGNVIDSAKESGITSPAVVTPPISTVTTPESLDNFIASNAYSNRAAYYEGLLKTTTFREYNNELVKKVLGDIDNWNAPNNNVEMVKDYANPSVLEAIKRAKEAEAIRLAEAAAIKAAADLEEAKRKADAASEDKKVYEPEMVADYAQPREDMPTNIVTSVAKSKSSNALLYVGVIAIGIVGLMLLKNK